MVWEIGDPKNRATNMVIIMEEVNHMVTLGLLHHCHIIITMAPEITEIAHNILAQLVEVVHVLHPHLGVLFNLLKYMLHMHLDIFVLLPTHTIELVDVLVLIH
jgi:hypothetical protein